MWIPIRTEALVMMIVAENKNDVWLRFTCGQQRRCRTAEKFPPGRSAHPRIIRPTVTPR